MKHTQQLYSYAAFLTSKYVDVTSLIPLIIMMQNNNTRTTINDWRYYLQGTKLTKKRKSKIWLILHICTRCFCKINNVWLRHESVITYQYSAPCLIWLINHFSGRLELLMADGWWLMASLVLHTDIDTHTHTHTHTHRHTHLSYRLAPHECNDLQRQSS